MLLLTGTAAIAVYLLSFVFVWIASRQDQRARAHAIVVLGAAQYNGRPSPVLRARLDHAYDLFSAGYAPLVVVTGGIGTGDRESEATVGRRYLLSLGVPDSAVVVRPEGRSTAASMEAVTRWLQQAGEARDTVLLVSDPFHMGRLRLEAARMGLAALTSPTKTSPISGSLRRELGYMAEEAFKVPVAWVRTW